MTRPILSLRNIAVTRNEQRILHDIDLDVNKGDFVVLVGANGSGKSTLIKIINGMLVPNAGSVSVDNRAMINTPIYQVAKHVATLTQDVQASTFSDLTVEMNLSLALHRSSKKMSRNDKLEYLARFCESLIARYQIKAGMLSGGQRQSLALAMCFAHTPSLLLLDEHTSALDPKASEKLMELTNEHVTKTGLATIMITHSLEHALKYGNRVIVLNEGRLVADLDEAQKKDLSKQDLVALAY